MLAGGFSGVLFVLRSDLEFLSTHFHLNNTASNQPCFLCQADRDMQSTWTDCRQSAEWRRTIWSATDWAAAHPVCHPLLKMPGAGLDLISPDLMHLKHLGTDQLLLGSTLTWMIKYYLKGITSQNLEASLGFYPDLVQGLRVRGVLSMLVLPNRSSHQVRGASSLEV